MDVSVILPTADGNCLTAVLTNGNICKEPYYWVANDEVINIFQQGQTLPFKD